MPYTDALCEKISDQLEQILESSPFRKSKRLSLFLRYVVEQTLATDPEIIRSYNIAVDVFGKGSDFDPGDPYVRNIARLARGALKKYYASCGTADTIRIDVPAGNYIATFTVLEGDEIYHPSESRDFLPSGNKISTVEGQSPELSGSHTALTIEELRSGAGEKPSLAVIPFAYNGSDSDRESVIGESIATGLIAGLSKSARLNVISWLSSTRFRNNQRDVFEVSRQLNCGYMISGNYICSGDRLTVYVEIADCTSREIIWAERKQCNVTSLLSGEADVVGDIIAESIRIVLDRELQRTIEEPLNSLRLHARLVGGMLDMHSRIDYRFNRVKTEFDQILKCYPKHTTVNALLAQWYVLRLNRGGGWECAASQSSFDSAMAHLQTALDANPDHSLALTMLGLVETQFNHKPEAGLELYNTAETFNPNEPVLLAYKAAALSYKGLGDDAIKYAEKALALSPFDPQLCLFHTCAAAAYYTAGDYDCAKEHADNAYAINPSHTSNLRTMVAIQVDLGDDVNARTIAKELLSIDPGFTTQSYLRLSPGAGYSTGRRIAERLEHAGIPAVL